MTVAAVVETMTIIERQYKEHPLQLELFSVPLFHPVVSTGTTRGMGADLNQTVLAGAVGTNDATIDLFGYPGAGPNS